MIAFLYAGAVLQREKTGPVSRARQIKLHQVSLLYKPPNPQEGKANRKGRKFNELKAWRCA